MFDTLLLAIDINDPEGSLRSTQAASDMARHQKALLHVLNVVPDDGMPIVSSSLSQDHNEVAVEKSRESLALWVATHVPDGIETEIHVLRGTVYDQIIRTAKDLDVDGIFVAASRPALRDYLIGPNAARVARHAPQSVFVIR